MRHYNMHPSFCLLYPLHISFSCQSYTDWQIKLIREPLEKKTIVGTLKDILYRRGYLVPTHLVPTHFATTYCQLLLPFTINLLKIETRFL